MKHTKLTSRSFLIFAAAMMALASTRLNAEMRDWSSPEGIPVFKAELANAFGDTAYFVKEDGRFVQIPIALFAKYDIAYIIQSARERDAAPATNLYTCQGFVAKDISKQWPNRIKGDVTDDKENINEIVTPKIFTFIMIQGDSANLTDIVSGIAAAEKKINGQNGHIMETVVITSEAGNEFKSIRFMLAKHGGAWLLPNEWAYKDEIWANYWRPQNVSVLVLDPNGTVLCDNTVKDSNGKNFDSIEFLNKFVPVAENIRSGKDSVVNPLFDLQAFDKFLAQELKQKVNKPSPTPIVYNFLGLDPADAAAMDGHDYVVAAEIGADGLVRNLVLKKGGDAAAEKALKQASTLWLFEPALKDGVPTAMKIKGLPVHVKVETQAKPAPASN